MVAEESSGLKEWVKDIDKTLKEYVHDSIRLMTELKTDIKHMVDRMDNQCSRIEKVEDKVDMLEKKLDKHDGERNFMRLLVAGIGLVATVAVPVIMYFTLLNRLSK